MLKELKKVFPIIIIDTSPLLIHNRNNIEPTLLSMITEGSVIIVENKRTTQGELESAVATLPDIFKIRGIVLNK